MHSKMSSIYKIVDHFKPFPATQLLFVVLSLGFVTPDDCTSPDDFAVVPLGPNEPGAFETWKAVVLVSFCAGPAGAAGVTGGVGAAGVAVMDAGGGGVRWCCEAALGRRRKRRPGRVVSTGAIEGQTGRGDRRRDLWRREKCRRDRSGGEMGGGARGGGDRTREDTGAEGGGRLHDARANHAQTRQRVLEAVKSEPACKQISTWH
jgi:hypothetical protein